MIFALYFEVASIQLLHQSHYGCHKMQPFLFSVAYGTSSYILVLI